MTVCVTVETRDSGVVTGRKGEMPVADGTSARQYGIRHPREGGSATGEVLPRSRNWLYFSMMGGGRSETTVCEGFSGERGSLCRAGLLSKRSRH